MSISSLPPASVSRVSPGSDATSVSAKPCTQSAQKTGKTHSPATETTALTRQFQILKAVSDIDPQNVEGGLQNLRSGQLALSKDIARALLKTERI